MKTDSKREAMLIASAYLLKVSQMNIPKFEVNLQTGVFKADGSSDLKDMLEFMNSPRVQEYIRLANIERPQPARVAPAEVVPIPVPATVPKRSGFKLLDLLDNFKHLKKNLKPATLMSYEATVKDFKTFLKNPDIQDIDSEDITHYQTHLAKTISPRTIDSKIGTLNTLFNFAIKQGYYKRDNPASNRKLLTKREKAKTGFAIFDEEEIQQVFALSHVESWRKQDPDFYYVVVLAMATGARISELTSLTRDQFKSLPVPHIKITDAKTVAGERKLPIPETLFQEILARSPEEGQIFKYLIRLGKGSGNAVSQKFMRHLRELGLGERKLVFHSIRKFVNNYLLEEEMSIEARCQLLGHELDNVNVQVYSKKYTVQKLSQIFGPHQKKLLTLVHYGV